jgi:hypothetical protein
MPNRISPNRAVAEHEALLPLLELVRSAPGAAQSQLLNELRQDAPTVVARVEQALADDGAGTRLPTSPGNGTFSTGAPRASAIARSAALLAACLSPLLKIR